MVFVFWQNDFMDVSNGDAVTESHFIAAKSIIHEQRARKQPALALAARNKEEQPQSQPLLSRLLEQPLIMFGYVIGL